MRITIYQIIPELDQDRLMFLPLSCFQKAGYQTPPAGIFFLFHLLLVFFLFQKLLLILVP